VCVSPCALECEGLSKTSMFLGLASILFTIAQLHQDRHLGRLHRQAELLRTDSANDPCEYLRMQKTNNPAKRARTTLSNVKREMLEPRLTESVRNALGNEPAPTFCWFPKIVSSVRQLQRD
jgi:hypothetical protein